MKSFFTKFDIEKLDWGTVNDCTCASVARAPWRSQEPPLAPATARLESTSVRPRMPGAVRVHLVQDGLITCSASQNAASPNRRPPWLDFPMDNLILASGPKLIWRDIHRQDANHPVDTDVAHRAVEFLYEPVTLDHGLKLGDVLSLLYVCPPLRQVFTGRGGMTPRQRPTRQSTDSTCMGSDEYWQLTRQPMAAVPANASTGRSR
jgi:hypothetical protein